MSEYLLGLLALPMLAGLLFVVAGVWIRGSAALENRWGISIEFKSSRQPQEISDFDLRRYIWFERQRGPIFTGHWYRTDFRTERPVVTRWLGIGSASGRSVMFYRKRDLA